MLNVIAIVGTALAIAMIMCIVLVYPLISTLGGTTDVKGTVSYTDDAFWKVFHFRFLYSKPYGEEFISGEKKAVVTRSLARKIFGTDDVVGKTLSLSFVDYTICGVVADVSVLAEALREE